MQPAEIFENEATNAQCISYNLCIVCNGKLKKLEKDILFVDSLSTTSHGLHITGYYWIIDTSPYLRKTLFSRDEATLYESISHRWSVCRLVGRSLARICFAFLVRLLSCIQPWCFLKTFKWVALY